MHRRGRVVPDRPLDHGQCSRELLAGHNVDEIAAIGVCIDATNASWSTKRSSGMRRANRACSSTDHWCHWATPASEMFATDSRTTKAGRIAASGLRGSWREFGQVVCDSAASWRTSSSGNGPTQPVIGSPSAVSSTAEGWDVIPIVYHVSNDSSHSMVNDRAPWFFVKSSASPWLSWVPRPTTIRSSALSRANCSTSGASRRQVGHCGAHIHSRIGFS
jgi:hypothetical protein